MKIRYVVFSVPLLFSLVLAACAPSAAATPEAMMSHDTPTADAMMQQDTPMSGATMMDETPNGATGGMADWLDTTVYDVHGSQNFMISDFSGKVILVETMAVWCTNCYARQAQIADLHKAMGDNQDFVSVSLDIDPNENPDLLKKYVDSNPQFAWMYAVAPRLLASEFGHKYGDQFLNPPSTPILIIDRHGIAHPLPFGLKSADDLMKAVQPYLDASM